VAIPHTAWCLAGGEVDSGLVGQQRRCCIEHPDVHELSLPGALAGEQRERDPLRREHAARNVGDGDAEPERLTIGRSGDAHQPSFGLDDGVVSRLLRARARLAEA
jgi:hypothetical protein